MINKISTVSFKNNIQKNDELTPREIRTRVYQEAYGDGSLSKVDKVSYAIGGAVALGGAIANKNIHKGIGMGAGAALATMLGMGAVEVGRNYEKSKEYARKYGNVEVDNVSSVQKVVQALTLPRPIDFGTEEKNKQYFDYQYKEGKKAFELGGISSLVMTGTTLLYSGICALTKKTKHLDKAPFVALASMFASMAVIPTIQNKLAQKNDENKPLYIQKDEKEVKPKDTKELIETLKEEIKPEIKEEVK